VSENRLSRLADELTAELQEVLKLKDEVTKAQARISTHEPDTFELRALGSILHDVYQGAENICHRIAKQIDRNVPIGVGWHRLLLNQMARALPKTRPAVIRSETESLLEDYRSFRHVFRNIYGPKLDWTQMKPLLDNAASAIDTFAADIEQFIAFLRLMAEEEPDSGK
jgi:hypothetical protein